MNRFNDQIAKLGPSTFLQVEENEKLDWWTQFKKCNDCHQCKEVCPICFCKKCYPESFQNFGIGWLVHVLERCTACGACQDVCPKGIRLLEIVQMLRNNITPTLTLTLPPQGGKVQVGGLLE